MSLSIFLLTGLSTSSFFLADYLTKIINNKSHSVVQLDFALKQKNVAALQFALGKSKLHSEQWLVLAKILAKTQGNVAYQLATYYQKKTAQAIFWYKSAIRLNYPEASIALAKLYFKQEKINQAGEMLATLPTKLPEKLTIPASLLKINIAINQGKVTEVTRLINQYADKLKKTTAGRLLLTDIKKYQLLPNEKQIPMRSPTAQSCDNSIQLFATNLTHLKHLEDIITHFKAQTLSRSVCFSPFRYIPINALDCNTEEDQAIQCDELNWQKWANTINTRYVGLMLPKGGANVHLGVLYFDAQDSVDVVAHEISHLLGFVDEYPLVANHVTCQFSQLGLFSHNVSVLKKRYQGDQKVVRTNVLKQLAWAKHIKNSTPILQPVTSLNGKQYWQLGTPEEFKDEVGLFHAQTCDNSLYHDKGGFSAFKPVATPTKLHYFALGFPPLYSALLKESPRQYLMPSFHYNIALAYFKQEFLLGQEPFQQSSLSPQNIEQVNYWLEQAADWENDVNRRKRVRQGGF